MRIIVFGNYDPDYNRTAVILKGLRLAGVTLAQVQSDKQTLLGLARDLRAGSLRACKEGRADFVFVPHTNWRALVLLAKVLMPHTPLVTDMLYSLRDNWIDERKLAAPRSFKAFYYDILDGLVLRVCDLVVVENNAHADYFAKRFRIARTKFVRVPVGADPEKMSPCPRAHGPERFVVEFHGGFFPMQGTQTIVRAAKLLSNRKDIVFVMAGSGQEYEKTCALAEEIGAYNVTFRSWVPYEELSALIADADICLGLLGDFPRVMRSTPNKLYETAAMGRLCINADTPAARDLFEDGKNIILVPAGDPQALAKKIAWLADHREERDRLERGAYERYLEIGTPEKLVGDLIPRLTHLSS